MRRGFRLVDVSKNTAEQRAKTYAQRLHFLEMPGDLGVVSMVACMSSAVAANRRVMGEERAEVWGVAIGRRARKVPKRV